MNADFTFWRQVPDNLRASEPLVFYNTLWRSEDAMIAHGTIASIHHPELGAVRKVDTRGLDYTITLADSTELLVDAEEDPGKLFERAGEQRRKSSRAVCDWRLLVEFSALGELTAEPPAPPDRGG